MSTQNCGCEMSRIAVCPVFSRGFGTKENATESLTQQLTKLCMGFVADSSTCWSRHFKHADTNLANPRTSPNQPGGAGLMVTMVTMGGDLQP
eukprot:260470-Pelagomonas_calceolata.AAC.1